MTIAPASDQHFRWVFFTSAILLPKLFTLLQKMVDRGAPLFWSTLTKKSTGFLSSAITGACRGTQYDICLIDYLLAVVISFARTVDESSVEFLRKIWFPICLIIC